MTVAFAIGQIAGPLLVRALPDSWAGRDALFWANALGDRSPRDNCRLALAQDLAINISFRSALDERLSFE